MYRVNENPLDRYPAGRPLNADQGGWMVARLKSRMEKALAHELAQRNTGYYLPLYTKRTIRPDNRKPRKSVCPLFPGYIAFVQDGQSGRWLKSHPKVAGVLAVLNQGKFIRELEQIQRVLASGAGFEIRPAYQAGDEVKIIQGPLRGLAGIIERLGKKTKLLVSVEMFGQTLAVDVPAEDVEKVSP